MSVKKFACFCAGSLAALGAAGLLALTWAARSVPPLDLAQAQTISASVLDRHGELLRAFTTKDGRWRLALSVDQVEPRYLALLKAYEDKRFDRHIGVDPLALVRAGGQFLRRGRIVSGASTLTMQVARLIQQHHGRTGAAKFAQMVGALTLEAKFSKRDILGLYLTLAPFGGNVEGVRAASLSYFGKEPRHLSVAEAALLVAIPQSPELRRPDRHAEYARLARDRVLARGLMAGVLSKREVREAKLELVPHIRRDFPKLAPHMSETIVADAPGEPVQRLTIDRRLQQALETLARQHARSLGPDISASILVADHHTGEILAYVGSSDYLDTSRRGAVDVAASVRSPGSTLKPIIYGLGFELGLAHPDTLIEDKPTRFGTYRPQNFDQDFHGTVTVRDALSQSLNIPAVRMLNAVGPGRLLGRLKSAGIEPVLSGGGEPTLAMALGGVGVRLIDLAQLYASLAEGGAAPRLHVRASATRAEPRRLLSGVAAAYVTEVLKDAPPPANAKGGRFAYKTGTSYGYRDALAIGFDGRHVVAVWVGRADGATTLGLTGRASAAPMLFDAFERVSLERVPLPAAPAGVITAQGGELPPPLKRFADGLEDVAQGGFLDPPVAIQFPPDRGEVEVADDGVVVLKAESGALPLTWLVDEAPIASDPGSREVAWQPTSRGFAKVRVIDAQGRVDRVSIRVR